MSISEFKSNIRSKGVARTNRFLFELNAAPALTAKTEPYVSNLRMMRLMCDTVQLPGVSFGSQAIRSYGEVREIPYEKLYEPVNVTFYVDRDMLVKRFFDDWMSIVQGSSRDFNYPVNYMSDQSSIYVYDTTNTEIYKLNLYKAYPKSIGAVQLDYSARDIMKINVQLVYEYFEISQSVPSLVSSVGSASVFDPATDIGGASSVWTGLGSNNYFNNFLDYQQTLNTYNYSAGEIVSSFYSSAQSSINGLTGSISSALGSFF